jgi:hypothetical protein
MKLSNHATKRMQQRDIPPIIVDLLQRYGETRYQRGSTVLYFNRKGHEKAAEELREALARIDKHREAYLVEDSDSRDIITVGYRSKRIKGK